MTIQLGGDIEALIREKVARGLYPTAEAAIEAAVQLLNAHDRKRQWLLAELQIALDQEARGELIDYTPGTMGRLLDEADERTRLGLPVRDAVKP